MRVSEEDGKQESRGPRAILCNKLLNEKGKLQMMMIIRAYSVQGDVVVFSGSKRNLVGGRGNNMGRGRLPCDRPLPGQRCGPVTGAVSRRHSRPPLGTPRQRGEAGCGVPQNLAWQQAACRGWPGTNYLAVDFCYLFTRTRASLFSALISPSSL